MTSNNKWLILGSMKELGDISQEEHQKIVDQTRATECKSIFIGPEFKGIAGDNWFNSTDELMNSKMLSEIRGALVLLKASRGIGLEKLIPEL